MILNNESYQKLCKLIHDRYGYPLEQIEPETSFMFDLDIDSLEMLKLIMKIEDMFHTRFNLDYLIEGFSFEPANTKFIKSNKILTIGDIVNYMETYN